VVPPFYYVKKVGEHIDFGSCILVYKSLVLCVCAKQNIQAQVEYLISSSILYDINDHWSLTHRTVSRTSEIKVQTSSPN
jgi:hypothetical protein